MAVVSELSNHYLWGLISGETPIGGHIYKAILMNDTFTYDRDVHSTYSKVSGEEISTGGYTPSGETLVVVSLTEDDTNDRARLLFNTASWTASGESMGPIGASIIFDDTSSDDTVVGNVDFGTDYTIPNGSGLDIESIIVDLRKPT